MDTKSYLVSQEDGRQFSFFAFISYKHKDLHWARWLQRELEGYRLPNRLYKEGGRPKRLVPICRDKTDFTSGGNVYEVLDDHLKSCKFLVVICSRHMQHHPEYIDYEIQRFLSFGNPISHVIPFVVEGEGCASDPANEAFPPALLEMGDARPLGITVEKGKKHDAVLKLVAAMQDLDYKSIRSHDHERRQKRFILMLSAGLVVSLGLGALMTWEMLSVKQAKLREENVYALETFEQEDRLRAQAMAQSVLRETEYLPDKSIAVKSRQIDWLSSIHPALSPLTLLEDVRSDKEAFFNSAGDRVILLTKDRVRQYDLYGGLAMDRSVSGLGAQFVCASPDGDRAVVLSVFEDQSGEVALWLVSLRDGKRIARLEGSDSFSRADGSSGAYDTVVHAVFSPDGRYVSAYRAGGFNNTSESLRVFDAQTGEAVVELDAALLGDDGYGNVVIREFAFLSDTLARWKGDGYYVLCDLESKTPKAVPLDQFAMSGNEGLTFNGHVQLRYYESQEGVFLVNVYDFLTDKHSLYPMPEGGVDPDSCHFFGEHFVILSGVNADGAITQIDLVDLRTMESQPLYTGVAHFSDVRLLSSPDSDVVYIDMVDTLGSQQMLRFNPADASWTTFKTSALANVSAFIGSGADGTDWFLAKKNEQATVVRAKGGALTTYTLDERYADFAENLRLSGDVLLSCHSGDYALYPLLSPGAQLDAEESWTQKASHLASSADGRTVAKAGGKQLAVFRDGKRLFRAETDKGILCVTMNGDGSRIACMDMDQVYLYDQDGTLLFNTPTMHAVIDEGFTPCALRMTADGRRLVMAEEMSSDFTQGIRLEAAMLRLMDGQTLDTIAILPKPVYDAPGDQAPAFDLSADGKILAAASVVGYTNETQRIVTLVNTEDGSLLARTDNYPVSDSDAPILSLEGSGTDRWNFSYVRFTRSGKLLAGLSNGVWIIDPKTLATERFVPFGQSLSGIPDQLSSGEILYPTEDDVYLLDDIDGALKTIFPAQGLRDMRLSADGRWLALVDASGTRLVSMDDTDISGRLSNNAVDLVYLDAHRIVYDAGNELYTLSFPTDDNN